MTLYKKKPLEVEAYQILEGGTSATWPQWLKNAWEKHPSETGSLYQMPEQSDFRIVTLEGDQLVSWGDYIIRGVTGEIYPCEQDIFGALYDEI